MADLASTPGSGDWLPPIEEAIGLLPPGSNPAELPQTGWTAKMPVVPPQGEPRTPAPSPQPSAEPPPRSVVGGGARGRILVVEGGYGSSGRRAWGRGGSAQAPVLSAMLAAVSPQILLAADAVDAVHLPGAADPQSVLAHLRAAARHSGPLLIHLGGHVVADRRGGQLYLTLRDSKPGTVRQDGLSWQAVAAELQHRPPEWDTLVIADLSADQAAWPQVQSAISPLTDGIPLWAVVSPDPEQIGTFTRALIEVLHRGRPGAEALLAPEQLRQQVYSVLRPDVVILSSHAAERPVFRNTTRQLGNGSGEPRPYDGPRPPAVTPSPSVRAVLPRPQADPIAPAYAARAASSRGPVSLLKAHVPLTPRRPARPVSLLKGGDTGRGPVSLLKQGVDPDIARAFAGPARPVILTKAGVTEEPAKLTVTAEAAVEVAADPPQPVPVPEPAPQPEPALAAAPESPPVADYREAIGRIVSSADAGAHDTAAELALELEQQAVAAYGPVASPVLQVRQVRAHVSRLAGQPALAADIYREVALTLLRAHGPEHPETRQAAANAEACWRAIPDRAEAIRVAPDFIELRAHLPGPEGRGLRAAERYLKQLVAAAQAGDAD